MQKKITVNCPKCRTKNIITLPPADGGLVMCEHCLHRFKIVPKNQATKAQAEIKQPVQLPPSAAPVSSQHTAPTAALPRMTEQPMATDTKTATRAPALNSLLSQSVNQNIQPVSRHSNKTAETAKNSKIKVNTDLIKHINQSDSNKAITETPTGTAIIAPEASQRNPEDDNTINNLNNLVFTLLPNAEAHKQNGVPLLLNDTIEKTEAIHAKTQYLHDQQDKLSKEFNWTLASLVALTVLIMQLFYLMAVK